MERGDAVKINEETKTVELSRRNLLSLLAKLDGHPPNSACWREGMLVEIDFDDRNLPADEEPEDVSTTYEGIDR